MRDDSGARCARRNAIELREKLGIKGKQLPTILIE
jgi:hypothetical protein